MIKERFEPQRGKTEPVGKTFKYVERRFIDLSYVCQQLADGCKVCKTEISLAHYEDEAFLAYYIELFYVTVLLYDAIHVVSFRKTTLISTIGKHEEIIKGV